MFDLGTTLLASAERSPCATAIVDGAVRLTYAQWSDRIARLVTALDRLGLKKGDRVVAVLQNTWPLATLHWACQLAGLVMAPLNWRAKADELDYCIANCEGRAVVYQDVSAEAVHGSVEAQRIARIAVASEFQAMLQEPPAELRPRARAEDLSLLLYTSGTTGKPKGVPRSHAAERAAAVAHVAQNAYLHGERTLGVMPLHHTMGVRSLLSMALIDGVFVAQARFDA